MNQKWKLGFAAALVLTLSVLPGWSDEVRRADDGMARAVSLLQQGILFEAIHELDRFVAEHPDHEEARMLLARTLYRVQHEARAAEEATHVLRINPANMEAGRLLTRIRWEIGQRLDRKDPAAVLQYARLCAVPGSYERAADFYRIALALDDSAAVHLEFGRMLFWAGHYDESAYHYELFLESNPGNANALTELGRVYNASGRFDQAISVFETSLQVRPDDLDTLLDSARALMWSGKESQAQIRLQELIRKQTGGDKPLMLLASIARIQDRTLDEYELLSRVTAANPGNTEAQLRINEMERGSMLPVARLEARVAREPENMDVRRQLVDLYCSDSKFGEALNHLDVICRRLPDDGDALERRRLLRAQEGRLVMEQVDTFHKMVKNEREQEIHLLRDWLERNTGDMKSRERLAELLAGAGDYAASVEQWTWLEAATPGNVRIAQALQRAQSLLKEQKENTLTANDKP